MSAPSSACGRCGGCCRSSDPRYIGVYEVDLRRMDQRARELTTTDGGGRYMRFVEGRCAALERDKNAGLFTCSIHSMRPDCCRWLKPHSELCRQSRRDDERWQIALPRQAED